MKIEKKKSNCILNCNVMRNNNKREEYLKNNYLNYIYDKGAGKNQISGGGGGSRRKILIAVAVKKSILIFFFLSSVCVYVECC